MWSSFSWRLSLIKCTYSTANSTCSAGVNINTALNWFCFLIITIERLKTKYVINRKFGFGTKKLTVFFEASSRSSRSFSSRIFFCSAVLFWFCSSVDLARFSNLARKFDGLAPPKKLLNLIISNHPSEINNYQYLVLFLYS